MQAEIQELQRNHNSRDRLEWFQHGLISRFRKVQFFLPRLLSLFSKLFVTKIESKTMSTKLINCPRCLESHELDFKELQNPIVDPNPADPKFPCTYHHWAICPTTKEPILCQESELNDIIVPVLPKKKEIETLAYFLWEYEGKPHGKDIDHWLVSKEVLTYYYKIPSMIRLKNNCDDYLKEKLIQKGKKKADQEFLNYVEKVSSLGLLK